MVKHKATKHYQSGKALGTLISYHERKPPNLRHRLENRLSPRRSAAIPSQIVYSSGRMACVIRNVSDTGAKLEVGSVRKIPNSLTLIAPGHKPQNCRVVWRTLKELGVTFSG